MTESRKILDQAISFCFYMQFIKLETYELEIEHNVTLIFPFQ